jgi:uncharacterized protein involved in exopolysaccharide biosynthesis
MENHRPYPRDTDQLPVPHGAFRDAAPEVPATDLRDLVEIAFKWKRAILAVFVCTAIPGIIVTASKRPNYVASGALLIKSQRVNMALSPGEEPRPINAPVNTATVNSEVQLLKSRVLIDEVALRLADGSPSKATQIARTIGGKIDVAPIRDSNIIQVSHTSPEPAFAARLIGTLLDTYVDYHARVHSSPRLMDFYKRQLVERELLAHRARERLTRYEKRHDIVAARSELKTAAETLAATEATLTQGQLKSTELRRRISETEATLTTLPRTETAQKHLILNPAWKELERRRDELEVQRSERRERYQEKHRLVQEIDENLATLERALRETAQYVIGSETVGHNEIYRNLDGKLVESRIELAALEARRTLLKSDVKKQRKTLSRRRREAIKVGRMQSRLTEIEESLKLFRQKADEAQIAHAMDREQLVNVSVVDRPQMPIPRVPSLSGVLATVAVVAALGLGLGMAYFLEFFRRCFRKEPDLERYLGVPALGTVREF